MKPGAFLPGPPLFFRSWREGHGLGGYGPHGYVWVLDPELPGLAGGCFALGSRAKGQGGGGPPPRGRCPTVVEVRTWVSGTDVKRQAGWGSAGSSSGNEGRLVRSTGTRSRAVGSQVRNDGRLHGPSLQMVSAALMTPVGNLSKASALSAVPPRVKPIRFRLSPLESPQRARPCPVSRVEPGVHFPVIPVSTCCAGPPEFSLGISGGRCCRCGLGNHVVKPGSQVDRCRFTPPVQTWAQDSFVAATITSAGPWTAQGVGIAGLPDS